VSSPNDAAGDADVVSKSRFAELVNVSPARVSQWISEGKVAGDAIVGEGRTAQIRASVACAQLKRTLDISQRFANGATTRLDAAAPLPLPPPAACAPPSAPAADPIEDIFRAEKLEQLRRANRKAAREEAEAAGRLTDSDLVRQQMGRIAAQASTVYEGGIPQIAAVIAASPARTHRDIVHLMRSEFKKLRAEAAKSLRRAVEGMPALVGVELELGDLEDAAAEPPDETVSDADPDSECGAAGA